MKYLPVLFVTFLIGCSTRPMDREVILDNDLGVLKIKLKDVFDTTYSWVNYSDSRCIDKRMYRFANKAYSLPKETGFVYLFEADSLHQVTISHLNTPECFYDEIGNWDGRSLVEYENILISENPKTKIIRKEILWINDRNAMLFTYKYPKDSLDNLKITVFTNAGNQHLKIEFECMSSNCDEFLKNSNKALESLTILD